MPAYLSCIANYASSPQVLEHFISHALFQVRDVCRRHALRFNWVAPVHVSHTWVELNAFWGINFLHADKRLNYNGNLRHDGHPESTIAKIDERVLGSVSGAFGKDKDAISFGQLGGKILDRFFATFFVFAVNCIGEHLNHVPKHWDFLEFSLS